MTLPVNITNLYNESGELVIAKAEGLGFGIDWAVGDKPGAVMGDILYAQINRLAAMAQREPLPDDLMVVMTHLIAAKQALDAAATPVDEST